MQHSMYNEYYDIADGSLPLYLASTAIQIIQFSVLYSICPIRAVPLSYVSREFQNDTAIVQQVSFVQN